MSESIDFQKFINKLREEQADRYLDSDKQLELEYVEIARGRWEHAFRYLPHSSDTLKILDIGTSPFTFFLKDAYPHYEVATVDKSNLLQTRCKARNIEFKICDLNGDNIPYQDNYFDVVFFMAVLDRLCTSHSRVIKEIGRIMRPGGLLILEVANFTRLLNRMKFLVGISPLPYADKQMNSENLHGYTSIHEYTMKECIYLLSICNFTIGRKEFFTPSIFRHYRWRSNARYRILEMMHYMACRMVPQFRGSIFVESHKP